MAHPVPKDIELGVLMGPGYHGETDVYARVHLEAMRLIKDRGVSCVQASDATDIHTSQLRLGAELRRQSAAGLSWQ